MDTRVEDARERWERRLLDPSVLRVVARHDSDAAEWFEQARWPHRVECLRCGSEETSVLSRIYSGASPRPEHRREWRCAKCECVFTVREDTFLEDAEVPLAAWCVALGSALEPGTGEQENELSGRWGLDDETVARLMELAQEVVESCGVVGVPKVPYGSPEDDGLDAGSVLPTGSPLFSGRGHAVGRGPVRRGRVMHVAGALLLCGGIWWGGDTYLESRQPLVGTWIDVNGEEHGVETLRLPDESREDWEARHLMRISRFRTALTDS